MAEQNNPYGPYSKSSSPTGPEGENSQSPNQQAGEPGGQNPYGQAPSGTQQGVLYQADAQAPGGAAQSPTQPNPYTQQVPGSGPQPAAGYTAPNAQPIPGYGQYSAPGYGPSDSAQPNFAQQGIPGYGQQAPGQPGGAYTAPGYGQPGFNAPTFDAYGNQIPSDAKSMALFAHLSGILGLVITISSLNFLGPLIFWFVYKDKPGYQFVRYAAAEAFNFSFTMWLINMAMYILTVFTFGLAGIFTWVVFLAVWVALIVFHIVAAVKANNGEVYNYPMTFRILR